MQSVSTIDTQLFLSIPEKGDPKPWAYITFAMRDPVTEQPLPSVSIAVEVEQAEGLITALTNIKNALRAKEGQYVRVND